MKRILLALLIVLCTQLLNAQGNNCSTASALPVNVGCSFTSGTSLGATQSFAGCAGNADDDVWYSFVATLTSHSITVVGSGGYDAVFEVFSGNCSSLSSIVCIDNTNTGGTESTMLTGLTPGNTYFIRVYDYFAGSGSNTFNICVSSPPAAPANDFCANATSVTVNAGCSYISATSYGATQSMAGCSGTSDDDVWFKFTANNYTQTIQVAGSANFDAVLQILAGACGAQTSLYCIDNTFSGGTESVVAVGLTPGTVYFIRVHDYYSTGGGSFSLCVSGSAISMGTQPNDNPCNATLLPPVTSACNYLQFSTVGATSTPTTLAPAPASCAGGGSPFMGGYSSGTADVWFQITVPSTGNVYITPQPNLGSGYINDGVMALYSGACGALTQISCSDDYTAYPGGANDLLPYIAATGLTPGSTVYLRYWGFATSTGSFGICVQSPTNDNCANALNICDLNGYSGSTSAAYTSDRPCNMHGNNETNAGVDQPNGVNTGGVFGQGGPWGVGSPSIDVNINNNSWIKFTAASANASFKINVANCWVGAYPSGGLQMQIFSALSACCNFTPVSDFKEGSTTFTINASALTVGANYYLMIDGYAGDICNYTITALNGVSFPNITATSNSICPGGTVLLTGPATASSYTWFPSGLNTNTLSVSPGSNITYTLIAGGVCGYKQTLTKPITVNPLPNVLINSGNPVSMCSTQTINLNASGASTYTWNTGATTSSISISPGGTTNYTVTGTNAQGCVNTTVTTVTVNTLPTTTVAASSASICFGSNATLTASGANTYTWNTGPTSASISVSPPSATIYTVTGASALGCLKTATVNVGVNALPSISTTSSTICSGKTTTLTATGGVSYLWSNSVNTNTNSVSPLSFTNYSVVGTAANGCTNQAIAAVSVVALPNITVNSTTLCTASTATLNANGGNVYNWSTGASGPNIAVSPTANISYTVTGTAVTGCSNTAVSSITVLPRPAMSSTPTILPSNCGQSTGSITAVNVTGVPALTYTWTNGSNATVGSAANLNNQPAGTYNLQVKDGNGCLNNFGPYSIINPGAPPAPLASASSTNLCVGATIALNATSSATLLNWSGPNSFTSTAANPTIPGATTNMSGVYSVYSTSAGCSGPASNVTVVVNALPTPVASAANSTLCSGATINLFSSTANTYSWTGPNGFTSFVQNPTITNAGSNASGLYQLVVTNTAGCLGNTNINVTINGNPTVTAFATSSNVCTGLPIVLNAAGGNSYVWSGPNGFNAITPTATIAPSSTLSAGNYSVQVTNSFGCVSGGAVAVNVNNLPTVTVSVNSNSICTNAALILNAGGAGVSTYSWTGPNAYNANGSTQTITPASNANAGNYSVTVTDINGCNASNNITVFVYSLTPVTLSTSANNNINCTGNTINLLSITNGNNYLWQGPNSFTSNIQNPTIVNATSNASGVYSLTVADANNCNNTNTLNVTVNQTPSLVNSNGALTCAAQNVVLTANFGNGANVSWYNDLSLTSPLQTNTNTYMPTFTSYGTYTFYAQASLNGCTSTVTPIIANYYNVVSAFNTSTITGGAPLLVNFTNTSIGINNSSNINWIFGDGNTSTVFDTPNNTFVNPGTYTVQLLVSNGLCTDTSDVIITVNIVNVEVPEVFTPNGDLYNPTFEIKGLQYFPNNELYIYNRWGNIVYSMKGYDNKWDGIPNVGQKTGSDKLPTGTYFYLLKLNDEKEQVYKGYVQLMY